MTSSNNLIIYAICNKYEIINCLHPSWHGRVYSGLWMIITNLGMPFGNVIFYIFFFLLLNMYNYTTFLCTLHRKTQFNIKQFGYDFDYFPKKITIFDVFFLKYHNDS